MCYKGEGVQKDIKQAAQWYKKAADQGSQVAKTMLSLLHLEGELEKAKKAARDSLDEESPFDLGMMYLNEKDYKQAVEWFKKSANQGNAYAQFNLGVIYGNGFGVQKDFKQAAQWFKKAADQGNSEAQFNLGILYQNGYGVDISKKIAIFNKHWEEKGEYDKDLEEHEIVKKNQRADVS